jgi:DNA-binding SARP family transcriptional activator
VPGGWIGLPFAAALAALGTFVWLRRRRRYTPDLASGLDEPNLLANSAVIAAARRQVQAHAPHMLLPDPDGLTTTEYVQALRDGRTPSPVPPPAPGGPELAGLPTALGSGGIGLTGPGAEDAARALLVATLTATGADDPDLGGHVITTHTVLTRLLGPRTADRTARLPRLITADTLDDVLARADNDLATRRILVSDADAADLTAYRADTNNEPIPPVVVITETPDAAQTQPLVVTAQGGSSLELIVVVLGPWPNGTTLGVDADGTTTVATADTDADSSEQGPRLAVLDLSAARDLLDVLIEASTGEIALDAPDSRVPVSDVVTEPDSRAIPRAPAIPVPVLDEPELTPDRPAVEELADEKLPPGPVPAPASVHDESVPTSAGAPGTKAVARVLGSPALLYPDDTPVDSLREAALELLVYLAVHREGSALDDVKEALYPDATIHRATQRLATDVGNLRNRVRHIAGLGGDRADPVINTGGRYHLNSDLVDVDWWTVQDLATSAKHSEDRDERMRFLHEAIDAYHGVLADGAPYEWLSTHQERSRRLGVALHVALAKELADTDLAEAAQHWDAASSLDPHHEDLAVAAIRAHARNHDAEAVRGTMRRLRRALDEIDEQPDENTRSLVANILAKLTTSH